jgi:hypothetical protein
MSALLALVVRSSLRRTSWLVILALHGAGVIGFVAAWARTNGVPLWQASLLIQLQGVERLGCAVLLTWVVARVWSPQSPDGGRSDVSVSVITGTNARAMASARAVVSVAAALAFVATVAPAFVAAQRIANAPGADLTIVMLSTCGFATFCVGLTSVAARVITRPLMVWVTAAAGACVAALSTELLPDGWLRASVPAIVGATLILGAVLRASPPRWLTDATDDEEVANV